MDYDSRSTSRDFKIIIKLLKVGRNKINNKVYAAKHPFAVSVRYGGDNTFATNTFSVRKILSNIDCINKVDWLYKVRFFKYRYNIHFLQPSRPNVSLMRHYLMDSKFVVQSKSKTKKKHKQNECSKNSIQSVDN